MLLDELDRTFEIESAIGAEDVSGLGLDRRPQARSKAARMGVDAALPDDVPAELADAAERLVAAGFRISRADDEAGNDAGKGGAVTGGPDEAVSALSRRELEVLALLAEGAPNKVIARRLDISVHTAKFHVASIIAKLGATNRTDATATAMRMGLVSG